MTQTPPQDRVNTEHLHDIRDLRRSVADRKVAGVAGGLGSHLNIDPTVIRVVLVVLSFFGGAGLLLYGAAWLLVPAEGQSEAVVSTSAATRNALLLTAAVLAGLLLVGDSIGGWHFPWALVPVALIAFLFLKNRDKPVNQTPSQPWTEAPQDEGATATVPPAEPGTEPTTAYGPQHPTPPWLPPSQPAPPPPPPKQRRGPLLFGFTLALLAIALGGLGLYDALGGDVADAAYPALALAVVGAMLVVGAWFGRAGGLVALGIVAAIALGGTTLAEPTFAGPRDVYKAPATAAQVQPRYFVPAGSVRLDLSNVQDVRNLDGRRIDLEANAGQLVVVLPDGVDADVNADVAAAGQADIAGYRSEGTNIHLQRQVDGGTDVPTIHLDLDVVFGNIEVRQS